MAGKFGRLYSEVWSDPDFLAFTVEAQHVYMMLLSSPQVSFAGVAPFIPGRYAASAKNMTANKFSKAVKELAAARFVVVDSSYQEILVRTYIKYDVSLTSPNVSKAVAKAIDGVFSPVLKRELAVELAKLLVVKPDLVGWKYLAELLPEFWQQVSENVLDAKPKTPKKKAAPKQAPSEAPSEGPSEAPSEEPWEPPVRFPLD